MEADAGMLLLLGAIAALGSFIYGVTGFGAGLVTIPLASLFLEMRFVLAVFALVDCVNAVRVTLSRPRAVVREEAARLVPLCIAGVAIGAALVVTLPASALMIALGLFVLAYALYSLLAGRAMPVIGPGWAWPAGLAGGVTSAMFGAGGPPYAIYLSMRPHGKDEMRATLAVTSLVSILARVAAFAAAGLLSSAAVWQTALAVVPASLAALWAADRVHRALSREAVIRAIRILLCVAGVTLVVRGAGIP